MTIPELVEYYYNEFMKSDKRQMMLDGEAYYMGDNTEICNRKMFYYDSFGVPHEDATQPNNKICHAFMQMLVDDKINYLLSKPMTLDCKNDDYLSKVTEILGEDFQDDRLVKLGTDSSCKGVSWLHPYYDENGELKLRIIKGEQGYPLYVDDDSKELVGFIWFYVCETFEGKTKKYIVKAEYWTKDRVAYFVKSSSNDINGTGTFILDSERYFDDDETEEGYYVSQFKVNGKPFAEGWGEVPFIPFKNNNEEVSDLKRIKTLIDNYDFTRSDLANLLDKLKGTVFTLRGYGGEDLAEFMHNLSLYNAVKVDDDGGLDTYTPTVDATSSKVHSDMLKKDIYAFGGGVERDSERFGNAPSGIALKFMFSGLDLKCNKMENTFKVAFNKLLYFIDKHMTIKGIGFTKEKINLIFNRDIAVNESSAIADCQSSVGIISNRTIVANHPWTTDVNEELEQIEAERKENLEDYAFGGGDE